MKPVSIGSEAQGDLDGTTTGCLSTVDASHGHEAESLRLTAAIIVLDTAYTCLCAVGFSTCVAFSPS